MGADGSAVDAIVTAVRHDLSQRHRHGLPDPGFLVALGGEAFSNRNVWQLACLVYPVVSAAGNAVQPDEQGPTQKTA